MNKYKWSDEDVNKFLSFLNNPALLLGKPLIHYFPHLSENAIFQKGFKLIKEYDIKIPTRIQIGNQRHFVEDRLKRRNFKWSLEEEKTIIECINLYPLNLQHAFAKAAEKLPNRTASQISSRYYYAIAKAPKYKNILTTATIKGGSNNRKNLRRDLDGTLPDQKLQPLHAIMAQMLNLSDSDRGKLLNFFN